MPTDLDPTFVRKRAEEAHAQVETTALLAWLVMCLLTFGLFFEKFGQ